MHTFSLKKFIKICAIDHCIFLLSFDPSKISLFVLNLSCTFVIRNQMRMLLTRICHHTNLPQHIQTYLENALRMEAEWEAEDHRQGESTKMDNPIKL